MQSVDEDYKRQNKIKNRSECDKNVKTCLIRNQVFGVIMH